MNIHIPSGLPQQVWRQDLNDSNTTVNDHKKQYIRHLPPPIPLPGFMDEEDDFPTPKACPSLQTASSPYKSPRRETFNSTFTEFEDFEEEQPSPDASEVVPFQLSKSIRRNMKPRSSKPLRPASIVIPSPSLWPSIGRPEQTSTGIMEAMRTPLSPDALAKLDHDLLRPPPTNSAPSAPSLTDGSSANTDGDASASCPPTPALGSVAEGDMEWGSEYRPSPQVACEDFAYVEHRDSPGFDCQLPDEAMQTLMRLSSEVPSAEFEAHEFDITAAVDPQEMSDKGLSISLNEVVSLYEDDEDALSPISIPSPGGFFGSLRQSSAEVWAPENEPGVDTITAESFYSIPCPESPRRRSRSNTGTQESLSSPEDPLTARRLTFDIEQLLGSEEFSPVEEKHIDDNYEEKLNQSASQWASRTTDWIQSQEMLMDNLRNAPPVEGFKSPKIGAPATAPSTPKTHQRSASEPSDLAKLNTNTPSKKSVRFADDLGSPLSAAASEALPAAQSSDSVLYHAFQHLAVHAKPRDAYMHRDARAECLRLQRNYRRAVHKDRLRGSFSLTDPAPKKSKFDRRLEGDSSPEEEAKAVQRQTLAGNSKQRRALEQLDLNSWCLQAQRYLEGGNLLPTAATQHLDARIARGTEPRILDFDGAPTASWGWAVALAHRASKIYTVVPNARGLNPAWLTHRGPSNHRIASVDNAWTLPFPAGFFDVISARSLHMLLKTSKPSALKGKDEWVACLEELHRVLAPGGVLCFSLLDAEVSAPANSAIAARGIEFAVALRTRGYDPAPGRHILPRFASAGFGDVRQSWVSLPWASGPTAKHSNAAVTGLVGSLAWEMWMLRFQMEAGRGEEELLGGVAEALDEASKLAGESIVTGTSWRMLVGVARKA